MQKHKNEQIFKYLLHYKIHSLNQGAVWSKFYTVYHSYKYYVNKR